MFNNTIRKIKRNILWLKLIKGKNDIMLYYPDVKAQDKRVNVHIHDVIKTGYDYYDNGCLKTIIFDYYGDSITSYSPNHLEIHCDKTGAFEG